MAATKRVARGDAICKTKNSGSAPGSASECQKSTGLAQFSNQRQGGGWERGEGFEGESFVLAECAERVVPLRGKGGLLGCRRPGKKSAFA